LYQRRVVIATAQAESIRNTVFSGLFPALLAMSFFVDVDLTVCYMRRSAFGSGGERRFTMM
jgi:hypothetical protein